MRSLRKRWSSARAVEVDAGLQAEGAMEEILVLVPAQPFDVDSELIEQRERQVVAAVEVELRLTDRRHMSTMHRYDIGPVGEECSPEGSGVELRPECQHEY